MVLPIVQAYADYEMQAISKNAGRKNPVGAAQVAAHRRLDTAHKHLFSQTDSLDWPTHRRGSEAANLGSGTVELN
jgi:hypothetical protein